MRKGTWIEPKSSQELSLISMIEADNQPNKEAELNE